MNSTYHRLRAILHLLLLQSLLPISLTYLISVVVHRCWRLLLDGLGRKDSTSSGQILAKTTSERRHFTVVLTGGKMSKTLHMVRCLRSYADSDSNVNLKIVVLEQAKFRYCNTRYSRCVDHFQTITSPRVSPQAYMEDVYEACKEHKATHFLPVAAPVEAVYDAQVKKRLEEAANTTALHMDAELCDILDDKHRFGSFLRDTLHLRSPRTHQVTTNAQVHVWNDKFRREMSDGTLKRTMVLKNLSYDPIHRLDLFQLPCSKEKLDEYLAKIERDGNPITKNEPWQLQEYLARGMEYAAMIVVRDNRVVSMTSCPSSASQLNYIHCEIPSIRQWLEDFMEGLQKSKYVLTGQLCFDFMVVEEDGENVAYPIECNPRVHTQCTIYNSDDVRAVFGSLLLNHESENEEYLLSLLDRDYGHTSSEKGMLNVYWFYNEFFKVFPNSWLLMYNGDKDDVKRSKMLLQPISVPSGRDMAALVLYLPAIVMSLLFAAPVLIYGAIIAYSEESKSQLTMMEHTRVIVIKFVDFLERLAYLSQNIEGDTWSRDPFPFVAKNHIQVPSRLLATIRTGVEWKKIDFAIGKVVEVGGD